MIFSNKIECNDLWSYLSSTNKTVVMYGMGNGADKILSVCDKYKINVSDFFASDGFVRGHSFHSKRVLSYSEIKQKYGKENIIVLLSFGSSLENVLALVKEVNNECELYAPDVPVCGGDIFNYDFYKLHENEIKQVYDILCDDTSREIYKNVINYKLSGKIDFLFNAESNKAESYSLLGSEKFKAAADLGAYNGDTLREIISHSPKIEKIYAFEPDIRNYKKLRQYCEEYTGSTRFVTVNAAAWCENTTLTFAGEGNRNSGIFATVRAAKTVNIPACTLDSVLDGAAVDYIKYDVEGAESAAIEGSRKTILAHRPALLVSSYHKSEDIFALPLQIHALRPDYKLYFRRYPYVPAWDLNLICI